MSDYVRLRADPALVRVSIRPVGKRYMCTVQSRLGGGHKHVAESYDVERAVFDALQYAANRNTPGVDLGMGFVYDHPMKEPDNASKNH